MISPMVGCNCPNLLPETEALQVGNGLCSDVNAHLLFHGTSMVNAHSIVKSGFDNRLCRRACTVWTWRILCIRSLQGYLLTSVYKCWQMVLLLSNPLRCIVLCAAATSSTQLQALVLQALVLQAGALMVVVLSPNARIRIARLLLS